MKIVKAVGRFFADVKLKAAEKKNNRKKAKRLRGSERILSSLPHNQEKNLFSLIFSTFCRGLVGAAAVVGIALFFCDAMVIVSEVLPFSAIFTPALIFSLAVTLMCVNRYLLLGGGALLFGGTATWLFVLSEGDLLYYTTQAVYEFLNAIIDRIAFAGLAEISTYRFNVDYNMGNYRKEELMSVGVALFVLLLSVLFVPAIVRRVRLLRLFVVGAVFATPVLAYNIIRDSWGFAILISAIIAVVALKMFERQYLFPSKKKLIIRDLSGTSLTGPGAADVAYEEDHVADENKAKKRRRGKDTDIEAALLLETPAERRARQKSERALKAREKKEAAIKKRAERKEARKNGKAKEGLREKPDGEKKLSRATFYENAVLGGPVGLCTFFVSMLLMLLPVLLIHENKTGIPYLDEAMEYARVYVEGFLGGDEVDLNNVSSLDSDRGDSGPRDVTLDFPVFDDVVIATVEAPYNTPVYLRTWIGSTYKNSTWTAATAEDIEAYRETFGNDFTPESITEDFYRAIYPNFDNISELNGYKDNTKIGFITERVNVTRKYSNGVLLFMPSFAMPTHGLMRYQSMEPTRLPYRAYYDGVWTSKYFANGTQYSTLSMVTTMKVPTLGSVYANQIEYYEMSLGEIISGRADRYINSDEAEAYVKEHENRLEAREISYNGDSILRRYVFEMTDGERESLKEQYAREKLYGEYVREVYTKTDEFDNNPIHEKAVSILLEAVENGKILVDLQSQAGIDVFELIKTPGSIDEEHYHEITLALINYMTENCAYTTKPIEIAGTTIPNIESIDGSISAVVDFLTMTRSGYCVQYASSLAMMLRSLGIPARYCEGYIAADFESRFHSDDDPLVRYKATVLDSDAHAWVEVYYDNLGWVQYEATDPYLDGMYGTMKPEADFDTPIDIIITDPQEPDVPDDDFTPPEEKPEINIELAVLLACGGVLLLIAVTAAIVIWLLVRRGKRAVAARQGLIKKAADRSQKLENDELRSLSKEVIDGIFAIYRALDVGPETGELPDEYAKRLDEKLGNASRRSHEDVLSYVSKEEFGFGMPRGELASLAEYYSDILDAVYRGLSRKDRFTLRYIRRII